MTLREYLSNCYEEFLPAWRREACRREIAELQRRWAATKPPEQLLQELTTHWTALYYYEQQMRNHEAKVAEVAAIKAVAANRLR